MINPGWVSIDQGKVMGQMRYQGLVLSLDRMLAQQIFHQGVNVQLGGAQCQSTRLQAGRVKQIFHHRGKVVRFFLNHAQTFFDHGFIPLHIITTQSAGIALNQRDGRLEFVANHRHKACFHVFSGAMAADITHRRDDIEQFTVLGKEWRVVD